MKLLLIALLFSAGAVQAAPHMYADPYPYTENGPVPSKVEIGEDITDPAKCPPESCAYQNYPCELIDVGGGKKQPKCDLARYSDKPGVPRRLRMVVYGQQCGPTDMQPACTGYAYTYYIYTTPIPLQSPTNLKGP
jgi:hypothetical protein